MKTAETAGEVTRKEAADRPPVEESMAGSIMAVFFAGSVVIGLWSMAVLVGGLFTAEGPVELTGSYFQAVGCL